ncbi:MAG: DUF3365 domain-containing protein [Planctomycetota bacterium]
MIRTLCLGAAIAALGAAGAASLTGCGGSVAAAPAGISPEKFADGVHAVMVADRTVYAKHVVTRLKKQIAPVKPDEYWDKWEEGETHMLPLPAQVFRMGASLVNENPDAGFQYSLKSLWPLNPEHAPVDEAEREALQQMADNPGETVSTTITDADGNKIFVKYYPDRAVAEACWSCHNEHERRGEDYPEFGKDDVMGGVAVYVPMP